MKDVWTSGVKEGEPFHVQLRAREWEERSGKHGPFWKIKAGLPKSNPLHEGNYDPEFITLLVPQPNLKRALEAELANPPTGKDKKGYEYWELAVHKLADGWSVARGYGSSPTAPAPAAAPSPNGSPAQPSRPLIGSVAYVRSLIAAYAYLDLTLTDLPLNARPSPAEIERMAEASAEHAVRAGEDLSKTIAKNLAELIDAAKRARQQERSAAEAAIPPASDPHSEPPDEDDDLPF